MTVQSVSPIMFESVSAVTATPSVELGTERVEAGQKYVYVFNCGISTASVGVGMSRPLSAFAGIYSGSVSAASGDQSIGFVKHADIPTLNYGWALKRGSLPFTAGANASYVIGVKALGAAGILAATQAVGYFLVGEVLTAVASAGTGTLYVNIP